MMRAIISLGVATVYLLVALTVFPDQFTEVSTMEFTTFMCYGLIIGIGIGVGLHESK